MAKPSLLDLFTKEQPFGPIISPPNVKDPEIISHLFYKGNLIYREMSSRPSLTVGRRGAGKTAFLRSIYLDPNYKIIIELPAQKAFRQIVDSIEEMSTGVVFVEEVSDLWNMVFWHTVLAQMSEFQGESEHLDVIKKYVSGIGLKKLQNPYNVMRTMIKILKERGGGKPLAIISEFLEEVAFNGVVFTEAQEAAINFMENENMRAIVLLDALEDFPLDDKTMCHAISGLLKCQGSFHFPGSPCELRCCIPSELYHRFMFLSSNPSKDFQHKVIIHWHASELARLAAQRYLHFLKLYHPDVYVEFAHFDLRKRSDAVAFWNLLLPVRIENRIGIVERPLSYILRHTQLLPRHLLMYLNQIAIANQKGNGHLTQFRHEAILDGLYETENDICKDIFSAYRYIHPGAYDACQRCIPYLPLRFNEGQLHRVYNRRGKGIQGTFDYEEFRKMMIEIGAIGRVTGETTRYIEGLFEYTVPHRLITSTYDELCLHPAFTEVFSALKPEPGEEARAIYPFGSDIDEQEFRDLR